MVKAIEFEREQIDVLVQEYLARGYKVFREPHLIASGVTPDILVKNHKTGEILIIEVVNFNNVKKNLVERVKGLQRLFSDKEDVKIEFRYIDVPLAAELATREEAQRSAAKFSKRLLKNLKPINNETIWYSPTVSLTSDWTRLARLLRASNEGSQEKSVLDIYNDLVACKAITKSDCNSDSVDKSIFEIFEHVKVVLEGGGVDDDIVRQMREHLTSIQSQLIPAPKETLE